MMADQSYRRLYRSRTDRVIGGVCGGLGDYLRIDPIPIRIAWLAMILFGGTGLVAYLIAWIIIPPIPPGGVVPAPAPRDYQSSRNVSRILGIGLLVVGVILLAGRFHFLPFVPWSWIWPLILVLLGALLLIRPSGSEGAPDDQETPKPSGETTGQQSTASEGEPAPSAESYSESDSAESAGEASAAATPDPSPATSRQGTQPRRMCRSRRERVIFGICGGMAEYFDTDPSLMRLLWVLLAVFSGGVFILAYLVMALVIPEEQDYGG